MGCDQSSTVPTAPRRSTRSLSCHYDLVRQNQSTYVNTGHQKLKYEVKHSDDFLQHHIDNEIAISPHTTSHKIRARQLLEHYIFKDAIRSQHSGKLTADKLTEFAMKAWFQRTFTDLLDKAEVEYFEKDRPYGEVKQELAEGYVFELYQMCSFINAGFGKYSTAEHHMEVPLSPLLLNSDSALYLILENLQQRYPLVTPAEDITFPEVQELKSNLNLLTLIDSKSLIDLDHYNYQSTMDDLKVLIDEANTCFIDFKKDMEVLLGEGVEVDCKVKWQKNEGDGDVYYNASAVRRIFIKWSQTLIQRIPEVCHLKEFMDFVRSKKQMADQFIFKGTVTPTTHQQVLDKLSGLLESIKCQTGTKLPRKQYGLFLYDLLRSKTTRKTGEQVVELLEKLKGTQVTSTGKRLEVLRIKNRFKKETRDLLVNFRYGEHLVGQVQLCIDTAHTQLKVLKQIKFRHMLYELERGLFGPTFEMIMQYEDYSRKDIVVKLQTEGKIKMRAVEEDSQQVLKMAGRMCPQRHEMIAVVGDLFSEDRLPQFLETKEKQATCDFCFKPFSIASEYHYCYYCSFFYCLKCLNTYKSTDRLKMKVSCLNTSLIPAIDSPSTLRHFCQTKKSIIALIVNPNALISQLFLDQITYLLQSYISHSQNLPEVYKIQVNNRQFQKVLDEYKIERTPTTLIFDEEMNRQITVVGCTFSDVEDWFQIRERIANGLPKGLKIKCLQCEQIMSKGDKESSDKKCQSCMDAFKVDNLTDLLGSIGGSNANFVCKQGHIRCKFCSYLSSNYPSFFKDYTGRSYLSNKFMKEPLKCSKRHPMDLIPTQQSQSYLCYKCKKIITDQISLGEIGVCFKCLEYLCLNCHSSEKVSFLKRKAESLVHLVEIVSHFAQNKLEEGYPCGCGKYFWRVYQSQKINTKKLRLRQLFGYGTVIWTCFLCKKEQSKLQLHLAFFYCKYAEKLKREPSHTEICLSCAMKSGLIGRTITPKVKKESTNYKCPSNHAIVRSSVRQKESMRYQCCSCLKDFHPYTERFECQPCKLNFCLPCGEEKLEDMNPLETTRLCSKNHHLKSVRQSPKLQFCRLCSIYLQGLHFGCQQRQCSYCICLDCGQVGKEQ